MKLNNFEFTGDYIVTQISHDSSTPQDLNTLELSRRDGEKLISSNFGVKEILIAGIVKSTSLSGLETNIDELKKAVMVTDGNFDIDYAGEYRRYIVNCISCTVSREHYNITYAPFQIKFKVGDPPFAKAIDAISGSLTMTEAFSVENATQESIQDSFSVLGSAIPKVKVRYKFDNIGDISSVDFINLSTSKQLNISTAFTSGDELLIDHDNLNITLNGEPVEFEGVFPDLKLGSNSFESNLYLSSGTTLDAYQTTNNSYKPLYGSIRLAQSFQVSAVALIPKIQLLLRKIGTISSNITLTVQTDSGNAPSGTVVTNGSYTISSSSITSSAFWINVPCTDLELSSSTTYWIVLTTSGGSADNYYEWRMNNIGGYSSGTGARYFSTWSVLISDFCFKVYKSLVDISNVLETTTSYWQNFGTDTVKDAGNTTADWNTSLERFRLPLTAEAIDQQVLGDDEGIWLGNTNDFLEINQEFIPTQSGLVSKIVTKLSKIGTPTGTYTMEVWDTAYDSESESYLPTTRIGPPSSESLTSSSVTTTPTEYTFTFSNNVQITAGNHYIIKHKTTSAVNSDNCYMIQTGYADPLIAYSVYLSNNLFFRVTDTSGSYFKQYYKTYIPANNIIQSNAVDSYSSVVASAILSIVGSEPTGTSIDSYLSSDGTNFEEMDPTLSAYSSEKYFSNIGSALKFKFQLNGTESLTPYVNGLSIYYKLAALISNTTHRIAQSFTSGFTGTLGRVKLNMKKFGSPTSFTVSIYSDSSGPDSLLGSQTYSNTVLSNQFGWVSVNFDTPASLTATTVYWIVISGTGVDSSNGYLVRSRPGNSYSNGTLEYSTDSGANYSEYANEDILMQTYPASGLQHQFDMKIEYNPRYL